MSQKKENDNEEIEETEKPKRRTRRKKKTDDSKFKELSGDDLETKDETPDTEPVVYEQKPVEKKPKGRKKAAPKTKKRQKSVMELASCPPSVNPKHWRIVQARARRKNQIN